MHLKFVQLHCHTLQKQKEFYTQTLGFRLLNATDTYFSLTCGSSILEFVQSDVAAYYHFAFNIPSFQSNAALQWLKQHVEILTDNGTEIIDFSNWNAEAIYFKDPAGNIVEFIARKNLNSPDTELFSPDSITEISEMGIPIPDVKSVFDQLNEQASIPHYWGDKENFEAMGNEHGLFILVNQAKKLWYPTQIPAKAFPLSLRFAQGDTTFQLDARENQIELKPV